MLPSNLTTPREVVAYYESVYDHLVSTGQVHPFLYPWCSIGVSAVFFYLLFDHRKSPTLQSIRWPVFAFLCTWATWTIRTNRACNPAASFGVGLISVLSVLIGFEVLVARDVQVDCRRVDRWEDWKADSQNKNAAQKSSSKTEKSDHRRPGQLYWQFFPKTILERIDWVSDLTTNFRGTGWNFQITQLPPLTKHDEMQMANTSEIYDHPASQAGYDDAYDKTPELKRNESNTVITNSSGIRRFTSRRTLLHCTLIRLLWGYLILDIIKTLMHNDPFFWGYTSAPTPTYLVPYLPSSPYIFSFLVKSLRLSISLSAVYFGLWEVFNLGPLFFAGILPFVPWIRQYSGFRSAARSNPLDMFSSPSPIWNEGLAGWWGKSWHQTFRLAFELPTKYLLSRLRIEKRSKTGRLISLFMAFFLSGCLHSGGSITQLGTTRPLRGSMMFFLVQPFGILGQTSACAYLSRIGMLDKVPKRLRQATNVVVVLVWLYHTAPLLVEDFARGGIFLYEPVAISPLRGLGFGAKDDTWWVWGRGAVKWRSGNGWWDTGLAF